MTWILLETLPRLHETPLAIIRVDFPRVVLEADDQHERRVRFTFEPYQAVRVVTADCFLVPEGLTLSVPWPVFACSDSSWIEQLKDCLSRKDVTATFLNNARHFLIPLQDDFVEVVARDVRWEIVSKAEADTTS